MNQPYFNDAAFLQGLAMGDKKAWTQAFYRYSRDIASRCFGLIGDKAAAEDLAAETWIKMMKAKATFSHPAAFKTYLQITARNTCLDWLKKQKDTDQKRQQWVDDNLDMHEESVMAAIVKQELLDIIEAEIDKLPRQCARIFKMAYIDGMKNDAIALELGIATTTVRTQKALAIEKLRKTLSNKLFTAVLLCLLYLEK